jgi:hypothetical protein
MRGSCRSTPKSAEPDARRRHAFADLTAPAYPTAAARCGRAGFVAKNMRVDFRLIADMIAPGTAVLDIAAMVCWSRIWPAHHRLRCAWH